MAMLQIRLFDWKGMNGMIRLNVYLIALGAFLTGTAELAVAGILPVLADDLRISIALAGQLVTAYSIAFAIGTPILVTLTSRMGRKNVLIGSLALFIVGCALSFVSAGYVPLLVSRVLLGLGAGVYSVVAISSAATLVPPDKMGGAISAIGFAFGSALTLGVPIGIAATEAWGWRATFLLLGLVSLLILLALTWMLPPIAGDDPKPLRAQLRVLQDPVIVSGFVFSFLLCAGNSLLLTYLTSYLKNILSLNTSFIGAAMFVLGVFSMIGSRAGGYGVDRWGAVRTIAISVALSAGALAILPAVAAVWIAGLAMLAVWMFSLFATAPALQTYFIQQTQGTADFVLGLNTSVIHLGTAAGAVAGGTLVHAASTVSYHPWMTSLTYVLGLAAAALSFALRQKNARRFPNDP
jgi:DHA1 family putative efflux transporter-like MFS transporter